MRQLQYKLSLSKNPLGIIERSGLIIRRLDKKNRIRYGEIAPLPPLSKETLEDSIQDLQENRSEHPSVRFGLQSLNMPWTGSVKVRESPLLFGTLDESLERVKASRFRCFKVKVSHLSVSESISYVNDLLKLDANLTLRIDANRSWSVHEALEFVKYVPNFSYLEEPVSTFVDLMEFSERSRAPVAVDESLYTESLEDILKLPSLKAVVVKPTLFGGYEDIFTLQEKLDPIPIVLSSCFESSIGTTCIRALASLLQLREPIGIDTYRFIKKDVVKLWPDFFSGKEHV